jgi:hypothetical protein
VSSPSLTPEEIRAAAETHHELGPDYQSAVIESFIDKVGREIDARVDARVASAQQPGQRLPAARSGRSGMQFTLALVSVVMGIPLTAIALNAGHGAGLVALLVVWVGIAIINVAFGLHSRPSSGGR